MTAILVPARVRPRADATAWLEAAFLATGLGAIVVVRWAATRAGLDALGVGLAFGLALGTLVGAAGIGGGIRRTALRGTAGSSLVPAIIGSAFGLALVGVGLLGPSLDGASIVPGLGRPDAPFAPWALITIVVAVAEEAILRGVLFDRLSHAGGTLLALAVTTALFALMHVPVYGWHVVALDLAVGLALGGLRLATRSVVAPAAAHVVADLATWWL